MKFQKIDIATFLAILFHITGWIGIVFTPYKEWFINLTPLNLCLMAALLWWNQPAKNIAFYLFLLVAVITGMGTEMIGVNTGRLFGSYQYGTILGPKLNGVPWLIGLNWFLVVFCSASCMQYFQEWFARRTGKAGQEMPSWLKTASLILDSALLAVFFDWIIEPVAMQLGYWQWQNNMVPFYNYACWFLISMVLLVLFRLLSFQKINHFAVHLFIIQILFFLALRTHF